MYKRKSIEDIVFELEPEKAKLLFEIANKARAEEAELFWKRANYFWLFVAANLATYGLLWRVDDGAAGQVVTSFWHYRMIVAALGLVGTFCWVLANLGSRWIFHKWLTIVRLVEGRMTDLPLYRVENDEKTSIRNDEPQWHQFSSTRLAVFFGWIMCVVWGVLVVSEMLDVNSLFSDKVSFGLCALLAAVVACYLALTLTRSKRT